MRVPIRPFRPLGSTPGGQGGPFLALASGDAVEFRIGRRPSPTNSVSAACTLVRDERVVATVQIATA